MRLNSRPRIIASAMSVTWNSSKQSSQALVGERRGGELDRVLAVAAAFVLLAELPDVLVHVGHELVEVHAPLAPDRRGLEEQVHQHGLAAADLAVDVEPPDRLLLARAEHPAERRRFARQPVLAQPHFEIAQESDRARLRRVALDLSGGDQARVFRLDG